MAHVVLGAFRVEFSTPMDDRTNEYRLRHAVFVEERHWLAEKRDTAGLEQDDYDDYSLSFLLRDAATGEPAACQRFILADRLPTGMRTPIQMLLESHALPAPSGRTRWAEVSRTTVAPRYRWGAGAGATPAMRGIKHASIALASAAGLETLWSVSDPRTARLVRRIGFPCHGIGGLVQYHGRRALYRMEMREIRDSLSPQETEELETLTEEARTLLALWPRGFAARRTRLSGMWPDFPPDADPN